MKKKGAALILLGLIGVLGTAAGCRRADSHTVSPSTETSEAVTEEDKAEEKSTEAAAPQLDIKVPSIAAENYPVVNGSTATLPLSIELYCLATGCTKAEAESRIVHTKTTDAYYRLIDEKNFETGVNLVLAYEPPKAVYDHMEESRIPLTIKPIGKDALVFMVNSGNPVSSLTEKQLIEIYTGKIKNWSQIGGESKEILAFQRPEHSGSQNLMEKLVMKEQAMETAPASQIVGEMGELIKKVASYNNQENALGYSVYYYAKNMFQIPGLRFMEVDGVLPSNESIRDGSYPYVNEFYAAIREDEPENSKARILFDWLTEEDGQKLIESLGYVGMENAKMAENSSGEPPIPVQFSPETGAGSLHLKEEEKLLLDGRFVYGTEGVYILNRGMQEETKLEDVSYPEKAGIASLGEPVILVNTKTGQSGLFDIQNKEWVLDPIYDSLYEEKEGEIRGYRWDEEREREELAQITVKGGELTVAELKPGRLGDYLWDEKDGFVTITGLNGAEVDSFDLKKDKNLAPGYFYAPYYVASDEDGDCVLLNGQGEVVFSKSDLDETFLSDLKAKAAPSGYNCIQVRGISGDGGWFEGFVGYDNSHFVYDLKSRKVVSRLGDQIESYISEEDSAYTLTSAGKTAVYNSQGGPLLSQDGRRFEYILGRDYYGYIENGNLVIENTKKKTKYELKTENMKLQGENIGYSIAEDTFFLMSDEGYSVWQKEKCLMENELISWWESGNCVVVSDENQKNLVLREADGAVLYKSKVPEWIFRVDDSMMAAYRGNYFYLLNFDGEYALRLLNAEMMDD